LPQAVGIEFTQNAGDTRMSERGLSTADAALLQLFTRRTGALLRWQKKSGILRSAKTRSMADSICGRSRSWNSLCSLRFFAPAFSINSLIELFDD
jgi:hypothetical protein